MLQESGTSLLRSLRSSIVDNCLGLALVEIQAQPKTIEDLMRQQHDLCRSRIQRVSLQARHRDGNIVNPGNEGHNKLQERMGCGNGANGMNLTCNITNVATKMQRQAAGLETPKCVGSLLLLAQGSNRERTRAW